MSTIHFLRAGLAAALLAAPLPLAAQSETATEPKSDTAAPEAAHADPSTVVATVNGQEVTLGHMIALRSSLPQQYNQLPPEVLYKGILDQLVQQIVLGQSLKGEPPRSLELTLQNERNGRLANAAIVEFLKDAVTEEQIKAAYDEKYSAPEGKEYKARHILVETEDEAKALIEQLDEGADFAALAQEKSTGPSGPNGGDLGWFSEGMMVKEFEDAVVALEPGKYTTEPVQTQFGFHVIQLEETRDKAAPTLDEVRGEIEAELQNAAVEAHIDALQEKAEIDRSGAEGIDPNVLTNTDLLE